MQWTDGTVVYIYHLQYSHLAGKFHELCSRLDFYLSRKQKHVLVPLYLTKCPLVKRAGYLCERSVEQKKHTQMQFPTLIQNENFPVQLYTACPSGHVTHNFLSCDLQSACWAQIASLMISCESPLMPLPPMFMCADQFERIPYPLVCDHRPDCRDYSDENFCVFTECSGASFQCGNKQVSVMTKTIMITMMMMTMIMMMMIMMMMMIFTITTIAARTINWTYRQTILKPCLLKSLVQLTFTLHWISLRLLKQMTGCRTPTTIFSMKRGEGGRIY